LKQSSIFIDILQFHILDLIKVIFMFLPSKWIKD